MDKPPPEQCDYIASLAEISKRLTQIVLHQQEQLRVAREALVAVDGRCTPESQIIVTKALSLIGDKS